MAWVYILKSEHGRYYIGSTVSLDTRIRHHQGGHTPSTKRLGGKLELMLFQEYESLRDARVVERRLKGLKRRDYIEKIVAEGRIRINPKLPG